MDIEEKLKTLPDKSGVYLMKNSLDEIIYVGKAKVLKNRIRQYFKNHNHPLKVEKMVENISDFEYIITDNEQEALILENNLIKEHMPKYNILLKDDKTYPFIKITVNEDFPRIFITRRIIRDGSKYFGPYCNTSELKLIMELIDDIFELRKCSKYIDEKSEKSKSCLYYQMNKCKGPCIAKITKQEYNVLVDKVIMFLNGRYDDLYRLMNERMKDAALKLDFETAASLRDRIKSLDILGIKQKIVSSADSDYDVIAVYNSNGTACVEIFFVRTGKIVGKEHYFLSNSEDESNGNIICNFMKQYYENSTFIPHTIVVQELFDDIESIAEWLTAKIDKKVNIYVPKIGDKLKLISMVALNAKKEHNEREIKLMKDISFKNNALLSLQKITDSDVLPLHLEAYDISNISGAHKVGAMVTYINGKLCRDKYRNFKIKYTSGQDDYACMREVLERRFESGFKEIKNNVEYKKFYPFPDMIFVDGGEQHLEVAIEVLNKFNLEIPAFGIVKDDKHNTSALVSANGRIELQKGGEAYMLLVQIQDEMHRRAISYHRNLRSANMLKSELSCISGVGEKRASILLKKFKSVKKISDASVEEITSIAGIDSLTARNIYNYFNLKK